MEARFSDYQLSDAASSVTVSFFRNGAAQGNPATVPIDGAWLRALQTMAERVRLAVQGASASTGRQVAPTMSTASARQTQDANLSRFTLSALLVNSYWYGSVAAGDTLCAVRAAAEQAGCERLGRPDGLPVAADRRIPGPSRHSARRGGRTAPRPASIRWCSRPCRPTPMSSRLLAVRPAAACPVWHRSPLSCKPVRTSPLICPPCLGRSPRMTSSCRRRRGLTPAMGPSPDRIRVTWDAVAGAISYEVYRDGLLVASLTDIAFEDTNVTPGATHAYTIRACNAKGCGGLSQPDDGYAQAQQPVTYLVTATAGSGGTISPSSQTVNAGATTSFTVTPNSGYQIDSVTGCGGHLSGTTYTTGPITADCTVTASFSLVPPTTHLVTTTPGSGGTIYPSSQTVEHGTTASFTVVPYYGYQIDSVTGCSGHLSGTTYTTGPITADCTVTASFRLATYLVTTAIDGSGTISPTSQMVEHGATASFTVIATSSYDYYYINSVDGCGGNYSGDSLSGTYTTGPITEECTVTASFSYYPAQ
jgi:hypothetical protein